MLHYKPSYLNSQPSEEKACSTQRAEDKQDRFLVETAHVRTNGATPTKSTWRTGPACRVPLKQRQKKHTVRQTEAGKTQT